MKTTNKQTALTAALFMILAANVSWQAPSQTSKSLNASDFASELGTNRGGSVPGRTGGVTTPAEIPVIRVAPAPLPVVGPKPDAPIVAASVQTKESTEIQKICSLDFKVHYIQATSAASGKQIVHAYITQLNPERVLSGLQQEGTYNDLIGNAETKAQWDALISRNVTKVLKQEGRSCDGRADDRAQDTRGPVVDDRADDADEARITRGRRNCTLDDDGDALRNSDRASCNLQRLASIDLDRSSDDRDEDTRGSRRRGGSASEGIREVQDALDPLKTSIRSLLVSTNSKRRSDGNRLLNRVLAALAKVQRTASTSADERAMTKLIDNLDKTYTLGQRVNDIAADKADKLADLDDKISDLNLRAMTSQNPYERFNLQRQAYVWNQYRSNELQKLTQNSDYLKLRAYQQAGLIDQSEFADFTADFNALAQTSQAGAMSPSGMTAPSDILGGRTNLGDSRGLGVVNPAFPQINYQQLGLQNPAIIGGVNPAVPSTIGYPQTSGFPVTTGFPQMPMYQTTPYQQFPQSNLPMTLPANVPITQGMMQPQYQTQTGWQTMPSYYNQTVMTQPMRL
jgi:hypothetical protein